MKRALLVTLAVLVADQALKVWIKLNFVLGETRTLFGDHSHWANLQFVENRGMAFGLEFGGTAGKLTLTIFRIVAVIAIGYVLWRVVKRGRSRGLVLSLSLIFAGALGNIIDSTFYGLLFSESGQFQKAVFLPAEGGYAPLLHGAVVDMFYFPIWNGHFPDWFPIWSGQPFQFFRPVFNLADAVISIGVAMLILVQRKEEKAPAHPLPATEGGTSPP